MVICPVENIELVDKKPVGNTGASAAAGGSISALCTIKTGTCTEKWQRYRNTDIIDAILKIHKKKNMMING